ncbi:LacI family DNA-binding transcriptional regulator [Arthrobacter sp. SX1312]|uniref:LacI family DNA-binding transcriptional regulator n=1 Tax=Arthrobacter sp. SX1312 TaxID=2058896 RepID=UPI0021574A2E|nr:LacI family DNA-binding transcriptional regulator [Arthrobacter sp. SX1312]
MSELEVRTRATLGSVAALAGVSIPTVSKVINAREDVAPATRKRVLEALRTAEYRPPGQRHALAPPTSTLIDVAVDSVTTAYYAEVMDGILECAESHGLEIVLSTTGRPHREPRDLAENMQSQGRRGLVLVTSRWSPKEIREVKKRGIAVVVIDPINPPGTGVASVGATNWAGGKAATEHLLGLGHTRIAFIGGPTSAECSQDREHGYAAALLERGIPLSEDYVLAGTFDPATGRRSAARLLALDEPPQAIFAASDSIALGVLTEAHARDVSVPGELSVIGFDGTYLSEQTSPQLTTVAQPLREMGRTAVRALIREMEGEKPDLTRVELATQLIVRSSTAPPPS